MRRWSNESSNLYPSSLLERTYKLECLLNELGSKVPTIPRCEERPLEQPARSAVCRRLNPMLPKRFSRCYDSIVSRYTCEVNEVQLQLCLPIILYPWQIATTEYRRWIVSRVQGPRYRSKLLHCFTFKQGDNSNFKIEILGPSAMKQDLALTALHKEIK